MNLSITTSMMFSPIFVFLAENNDFRSMSLALKLYEAPFERKRVYDDDDDDSHDSYYDLAPRPTHETIKPFGPITENNYKNCVPPYQCVG